MKALYYIKTTLKGLVSNLAVTIIYFICFPIFMAAVMGFMQNSEGENPLKLKQLKVEVVDQDNSEMSQKLTQWLESEEIKELVEVVKKEPEVQLVINEGYEENILKLKAGNITINKFTDGRKLATESFKSVLNQYHKNVYVAINGGNLEKINSIKSDSIIKDITIDTLKGDSPYKKIAGSMLGMVITMLMFSMIQGGYLENSINLDKRVIATPITKLQYLVYDTLAMLAYSTIILLSYVFFFRIAGIAFGGNIFELILLVLVGSVITVSMAKCITTLFGAKYGRIVGTALFILPIAAGEALMGSGNKLTYLTPTHYLNNVFTLYNLNGNLQGCGKWIMLVLAISIICFALAVIKTVVTRGKNACA